MTKSLTACLIAILCTCVVSVSAQRDAGSEDRITSSEATRKRLVLAQIIRHEGSLSSDDMAAIIRTGLKDSDSGIREGALAAIVARAAGQQFTAKAQIVDDWHADRDAIQRLRPAVALALEDSDEKVRLQAIAALASLDFSPSAAGVELSATSREALTKRFYADASPRIRAKIVGGFATDRTNDPGQTRKLMLDAVRDDDHRVRSAATLGMAKLGSDGVEVLVKLLVDQHPVVRGQAAIGLTKAGPIASDHMAEIDRALQGEPDPVVRRQLVAARAAVVRNR